MVVTAPSYCTVDRRFLLIVTECDSCDNLLNIKLSLSYGAQNDCSPSYFPRSVLLCTYLVGFLKAAV